MQKLKSAHKHSYCNKDELSKSVTVGCFFCKSIFKSNQIIKYIDDSLTGLCPECEIDSLIGDASGFEINRTFLKQMYDFWFGGIKDEHS